MSHDPHLWLEQIDDPAALAWVEQQNQQTVNRYSESARFKELQNRFRAILDSDERIPISMPMDSSSITSGKPPRIRKGCGDVPL